MATASGPPRAGRLAKWTGMPILSRSWDAKEGIPDLSGKVAIVTGANTGVGLATTEQLLRHGCKVYLACRSESKATEAVKQLSKDISKAEELAVYLPFELTDLKSAQDAAKTILDKENRLDIIIANAGVMGWPYKLVNGIEVQFWNHLGHFALIQPLLPLLVKTSKLADSHVRIVNVTSMGHMVTPRPDFTSIDGVNKPLRSTWDRYGQSKLCNILYTKALQTRLGAENIRCLAVHPGVIHSELLRGQLESTQYTGRIMHFLSGKIAMSTAQGALTQLWAATSPEVDQFDLKGEFCVPYAQISTPSALARDHELADELWNFSEQTVKTLAPKAML